MSHVTTIDLEIKDLESLAKACEAMGLELMLGQKTYKWFGRHVGDYPFPPGFTKDDLGKCEHAIRVKGNAQAYEIGVAKYPAGTKKKVKLADGSTVEVDVGGKYTLLFDFWNEGYGLMTKAGKDCGKLLQEYAAQVATKQARKQGYAVNRKLTADGKIQLVCRA